MSIQPFIQLNWHPSPLNHNIYSSNHQFECLSIYPPIHSSTDRQGDPPKRKKVERGLRQRGFVERLCVWVQDSMRVERDGVEKKTSSLSLLDSFSSLVFPSCPPPFQTFAALMSPGASVHSVRTCRYYLSADMLQGFLKSREWETIQLPPRRFKQVPSKKEGENTVSSKCRYLEQTVFCTMAKWNTWYTWYLPKGIFTCWVTGNVSLMQSVQHFGFRLKYLATVVMWVCKDSLTFLLAPPAGLNCHCIYQMLSPSPSWLTVL